MKKSINIFVTFMVAVVLLGTAANGQQKKAPATKKAHKTLHAKTKDIEIEGDASDVAPTDPRVDATVSFYDRNGATLSFTAEAPDAPYFVLDNTLTKGSQYKIDITGYSYAVVLAFSHTQGSWDVLYPKVPALATKDLTIEPLQDMPGDKLTLPAGNGFFTIKGDNMADEQFLVLVSNRPFDADKVGQLDRSSVEGTAILPEIHNIFGQAAEAPVVTTKDIDISYDEVNIAHTGKNATVTPLYFKIKRG